MKPGRNQSSGISLRVCCANSLGRALLPLPSLSCEVGEEFLRAGSFARKMGEGPVSLRSSLRVFEPSCCRLLLLSLVIGHLTLKVFTG